LNAELAAAYNDLNKEFESHKAEHGSVVVSNRDLSARIDALKANLIEYEERYELCRNENAETVQQLEKLSNDFDRLRLSLSKNTAVEVVCSSLRPGMSVFFEDELKRLRTELDVSKGDREKLRADVERFRAAIGVIDKELNRLRESNDKLMADNKALGSSLERFTEIRNMLENSDSELRSLREKFVQLQEEHQLKEQEWREQLTALTEARDEAKRQLEEFQRQAEQAAVCDIRSSDDTPSTELVELKTEGIKSTATSSEGTADSNNGWEKVNTDR
uniref:IF rod domain-containing protein n=1 Tax=Gongylonema pulchrum TaxID=637853 RepID=A0A183EU02_9BILA